jgi:hypothetical protein
VTSSQPGTDDPAGRPPGSALLAALVGPLLDARSQPAAAEFDRLISAAVASGGIDQALARQLRFWQRASVHELADHVRTVLPAVLPVAMTAVTASAAEADASAVAAEAAWQTKDTKHGKRPAVAPTGPDRGAEAQPDVVVSAADGIAIDTAPAGDDTQTAAADSNTHLRRRMFVAGLTSTA